MRHSAISKAADLICVRRHVEFVGEDGEFGFAFGPIGRRGAAQADAGEDAINLPGGAQDAGKRRLSFLGVLKNVEHGLRLGLERFHGGFRVFFLAGLSDGALGNCGIEAGLETLAVFFQILHRVFDVLVTHALLGGSRLDKQECQGDYGQCGR